MKNNIAAEQALIGAILLEPTKGLFICAKKDITESDISDPLLNKCFRAIRELAESRESIDTLTVQNKAGIPEPIDYIVDGTPTAAHAEYYATQVKEASTKRRMIAVLSDIADDINEKSVHESMEMLHAELTQLSSCNQLEIKKLSAYKDEQIENWKQAKNVGYVGIPFSLGAINQDLGGWRNGVMGIIAAYRGEGKSTIIRQQCLYLAQMGVPVALLSLEDPGNIASSRIVGAAARVNVFGLDIGRYNDESLAKMRQTWDTIGDIPLYISSDPMDMTQIDSTLTLMKARYGIKIAFIDHVQYITPYQLPGRSRNDTLAGYSGRIVAAAKVLDIPIVVASQLSRSSEKDNRKPRLSDLRDSGTLEQDARQIIILHRDNEAECHILRVAKNNYGASGNEIFVTRNDAVQMFEEAV